jgi:hypothetical protein
MLNGDLVFSVEVLDARAEDEEWERNFCAFELVVDCIIP